MTVGERIKKLRKEKKISVDYIAKEIGVSCSTIYRYEDSSIEKIPINIIEKLSDVLGVSTAELMGNDKKNINVPMPEYFINAQDAMEFILKTPTLAAYGGYDPHDMSEETIVEFANEILQQLKLVSYKYKSITKDER